MQHGSDHTAGLCFTSFIQKHIQILSVHCCVCVCCCCWLANHSMQVCHCMDRQCNAPPLPAAAAATLLLPAVPSIVASPHHRHHHRIADCLPDWLACLVKGELVVNWLQRPARSAIFGLHLFKLKLLL